MQSMRLWELCRGGPNPSVMDSSSRAIVTSSSAEAAHEAAKDHEAGRRRTAAVRHHGLRCPIVVPLETKCIHTKIRACSNTESATKESRPKNTSGRKNTNYNYLNTAMSQNAVATFLKMPPVALCNPRSSLKLSHHSKIASNA